MFERSLIFKVLGNFVAYLTFLYRVFFFLIVIENKTKWSHCGFLSSRDEIGLSKCGWKLCLIS